MIKVKKKERKGREGGMYEALDEFFSGNEPDLFFEEEPRIK